MHILYGGFRSEYEHFSFKFKSLWSERIIFESPPQSRCFQLGTTQRNPVQILL